MNARPDLSQLDTSKGAEEGRELVIKHFQTGEPVGITLRVHGADSAAYRDCMRRQQRQIADRMAKNRKLRLTVDEMEANGLELLAAVTIGWSPFDLDGKDFPWSEENAAALYRRFPWIRDQVDEFVGDRANFLPRSEPT